MATTLSFLDVAELVLFEHDRPLTADDIVRLALERNELKTRGATPETAMRARLSVDIRDLAEYSRFQRVGPNRFALRRWTLNEYATRSPVEVEHESVACISQESVDKVGRFFGYEANAEPYKEMLSDRKNIIFLSRTDAEVRDDVKQLICYVVLENAKGEVLTYRRGAQSTSAKFLKGSYCIGFGGHVQEDDAHSLFGYRDGGIVGCSLREVGEELRALSPKNLRLVGAINDDSSPNGLRHFAFVFRAQLPDSFSLETQRHELSVGSLSLLSRKELWTRFHKFEFWSQLLVRNFYSCSTTQENTVIASGQVDLSRGPIVLVGEISSGKTEIANWLQRQLGMVSISTRDCVASLINAEDFGTGDRNSFQQQAASLVSTERGLDELAIVIAKRVGAHPRQSVIVDGVRNVGTLGRLRKWFPGMILLYVDAPRDLAYAWYCKRSGRPPTVGAMTEFRMARNHAVEREVPLLKYRANRSNAYIFNGGTIAELRKTLAGWWRVASDLSPP